jgi:predicted dehydrogenase
VSDAAELVASAEVDVVHVCTPNDTHAPLVRLALAAGKHVVCEKPLATDPADSAELAQLAAEAGVVAAVPFVYRFYATVRHARAGVTARHGPPSCTASAPVTRCRRRTAPRWPSRPTPERPARSSSPRPRPDARAVSRSSSTGTLTSLTSLAFNQERPEELCVGGTDAKRVVLRDPAALDPAATPYAVLPAGHAQGHQDAFDAFTADVSRRVRGEGVPGLPTFADGVRAARITDAVVRSSRTRTRVEVPA